MISAPSKPMTVSITRQIARREGGEGLGLNDSAPVGRAGDCVLPAQPCCACGSYSVFSVPRGLGRPIISANDHSFRDFFGALNGAI